MCKIGGIIGIKKGMEDTAFIMMDLMSHEMSYGNSNGLGYVGVTRDGVMWGEKWVTNKQAFARPVPEKPKEYLSFGSINPEEALKNPMSLLFHTRARTTGPIDAFNAHPFFNQKLAPTCAIIHNGMIYNHEDLTKKIFSECDSEVILHEYQKAGVAKDPENIKVLGQKLEGWYAVGAMTKLTDGTIVVDYFTDGTSLSIARTDIGTVLCTAPYIIKGVFETFDGIKIHSMESVKADTMVRLNPSTGEVICTKKFDSVQPRVYSVGRGAKVLDFATDKEWEEWMEKNFIMM